MLQIFALKLFFYVPIWLLKIVFYKKRKILRGHQFDAQAAALLFITPKTDLSVLADNEIPNTRNSINKNRKKTKLSLMPSREVKKN